MADSTSKVEIHTVGAVASITSFVTWILARFVFHGEVPPEVIGMIFLAVPYGLSVGAGYVARRRRLRTARDAAYIRSLKVPRQLP